MSQSAVGTESKNIGPSNSCASGAFGLYGPRASCTSIQQNKSSIIPQVMPPSCAKREPLKSPTQIRSSAYVNATQHKSRRRNFMLSARAPCVSVTNVSIMSRTQPIADASAPKPTRIAQIRTPQRLPASLQPGLVIELNIAKVYRATTRFLPDKAFAKRSVRASRQSRKTGFSEKTGKSYAHRIPAN